MKRLSIITTFLLSLNGNYLIIREYIIQYFKYIYK